MDKFRIYKSLSLKRKIIFLIISYRAFEVSALIFAPIAGAMLERIGRKNSIVIGFVITVLSTTAIGFCDLISRE